MYIHTSFEHMKNIRFKSYTSKKERLNKIPLIYLSGLKQGKNIINIMYYRVFNWL